MQIMKLQLVFKQVFEFSNKFCDVHWRYHLVECQEGITRKFLISKTLLCSDENKKSHLWWGHRINYNKETLTTLISIENFRQYKVNQIKSKSLIIFD